MTEWIRVEDRLPKFDTPVFGLVNGKVGVYCCHHESGDGWFWEQNSCTYDILGGGDFSYEEDYDVSYWIPIPDALLNIPKDAK